MGFVSRMSVSQLVMLTFGVICAILLAVGMFFFLNLRIIEHHDRAFQAQILQEWTLSNGLSRNLRLEQLEVYQHVQTNDGAEISRHGQIIEQLKAENKERWNEYEKLVDNPEEVRLYKQAMAARKKFLDETSALLALSRAKQDAEARELAFTEQGPAYEEYQKTIIDIDDATEREGSELAAASTRAVAQTIKTGDELIGVALVVAIATAFLLIRITRQLRHDNYLMQQAEKELQWKTALLEAQINSSLDGLLILNDEGKRLVQNEQMNALWEIPPDIHRDPDERRQIEWTLGMAADPGMLSEKLAYFQDHPGEVGRQEVELKNGTVLDQYTSPVINREGTSFGRIWAFRDITEQKQTLKELDEKQRVLDAVLRNSLDGVIACDSIRDAAGELLDFRFLVINPAAEVLLGQSASTLLGRGLLETSPNIVLDGLFESFVRIVEGGEILDFEYSAVRAGVIHWYRVAGTKLADGLVINYSDITERKQTTERHDRMFQLSLDIMCTVSFDGHARQVNPACERIMGRTREALLAEPFIHFVHPDDRAAFAKAMERAVAGEATTGFEIRCEVGDGSYKWIQWSTIAVPEEELFYSTGRDITERKKVEDELQWKNALLEAQIDSSVDGILVVAPNQRKILQNQRTIDLWKIPPEIANDPAAAPQLQWVANMVKDQAGFLDMVKRLRSNPEELSRGEVELKDGTILDRYSSPIVGKNNEYYGRITTFRDITARKAAEEELKRLSAEHELILNAVGEGVHWIGEDGRIKFENPASAKMLGYEPEELVGKSAHQTMHHSRADGTPFPVSECSIYDTLQTGVGHRVKDEVFWRKDGTSFPVEYISMPLRDEAGRLAGTVVVFSDISERKRIEGRLLQSQKMETVGKLAGGIAHEFNSILTAIIGQSELMLNDLPVAHPLIKNATEIRQAADRAASLTRQLLAYGRKQILQPEVLDLNLVLADMESTLNHLIGKDAHVRIVPGSKLKAVKMDPGQIEQVIVNIAMNAAAAMPNGGQLTLETSNTTLDENYVRPFPGLAPGEYVLLAMSDTGSGMKDEVKARIFEPFFSTKGVGQGPGLGLSTCYGIVKQSGGHISVYSELGRGSTFKVYLPQVEPQEKTPVVRATPSEMPRGNETILLAEDDPALLEMSATFLRKLGYTVLTATNGVEALGLKHQRDIGHIDLLFTDVVMPHMSGKELSDRIHAIYPHTKILFTSAYTENAVVHQGILNEGVTLLQKPFTPSALASKIREVLDR